MMNSGPLPRYQDLLNQGDIQPDAAQQAAANQLQHLYAALVRAKPAPSLLARLFDRVPSVTTNGLYFWGGVGRGKTFLMDLFFDSLPFAEKQRIHFHRFMRFVHTHLKQCQGEVNPLRKIAREFAQKIRVLCFDEFFVSDITDAMILAGILETLFAQGLVLVTTSNVEPDNLYQDGLQRGKFLPAIDLLKQNTQVFNLDGDVDYRLRTLESAEIFHYPLDAAADISLCQSFVALSPNVGEDNIVLEVEGRPIKSRKCGDGVVWFDFAAICQGPRSQNDYIELAKVYQTVLISNVPQLTISQENAARRFISLVDEFYDHHVKLILSAAVPITSLYQGKRLVFEFRRTASRLQEMQSHDYLSQQHSP